MSLFGKFEKRAIGPTHATGGNWSPIRGAGIPNVSTSNDPESALEVSTVHFCVSQIADAISMLPVDVYRKKDDKRVPVEQPVWTKTPNQNDTFVDFISKTVTSLLFDGNAYIFTLRNDRGAVVEMHVLDPNKVDVKVDDNNSVYFLVDGKRFTRSEILHIKGLTVPGGSKGISPLEKARLSVSLAKTAEKFGNEYFDNGIHMSGVIEVPKEGKVEDAQRLSEQFGARHTGGKHAVGVLTGGATWKPITITPEQAQFLETRKFNRVDIALFYKIPAYMVDPTVTSTWGSGIAEQNLMFLNHTLMPYIVRIEQAFSQYILAGQQYFKFNTRAFTRGRAAEEMELLVKATNNGLMTINEGRALMDLEPIEGGDEMMLPLNISPISHQERKLELQESKAEVDANAANGGNINDTQD